MRRPMGNRSKLQHQQTMPTANGGTKFCINDQDGQANVKAAAPPTNSEIQVSPLEGSNRSNAKFNANSTNVAVAVEGEDNNSSPRQARVPVQQQQQRRQSSTSSVAARASANDSMRNQVETNQESGHNLNGQDNISEVSLSLLIISTHDFLRRGALHS